MSKATLKVQTPTDREAVITRDVAAPRAMVFDAPTTPADWCSAGRSATRSGRCRSCEIDLRAAASTATLRKEKTPTPHVGFFRPWEGTFTEVVRPSRVVATPACSTKDGRVGETVVVNGNRREKGKSTITTRVRLFLVARRDDTPPLKTGMTTGMEAGYERRADAPGDCTC